MRKFLKFKSDIAIALVLAILVTTVVPRLGRASEPEELLSELEELLMYELSEENIEVESVDIALNEIAIDVSVENSDGEEILATIEFAPGDYYITFFVSGYDDDGVWEERELILDLTDVEDYMGEDGEMLNIVIEDVETGEIFEYCSEYGELAGVITLSMVSIGIIASLATLSWLLLIGVVVIIAGIVWLRATEADTSRRDRSFNHFRARIHRGHVVISRGISRTSARNRLRNGNDTWSVTRAHALDVATRASGTFANGNRRTPSGPENHANTGRRGSFYMNHFHPNPRTGAHAFFGFSVTEGRRWELPIVWKELR